MQRTRVLVTGLPANGVKPQLTKQPEEVPQQQPIEEDESEVEELTRVEFRRACGYLIRVELEEEDVDPDFQSGLNKNKGSPQEARHLVEIKDRTMIPFVPPDHLSFQQESCLCGCRPSFGIRNGKLLLRCKQKRCPDVEWSGKDDVCFPQLVCTACNKPTNLLLSQTEKIPGKIFYKCALYKYFRWWNRSLQASFSASSSANAISSASSSASEIELLGDVGKVLCTVGDMLKNFSFDKTHK